MRIINCGVTAALGALVASLTACSGGDAGGATGGSGGGGAANLGGQQASGGGTAGTSQTGGVSGGTAQAGSAPGGSPAQADCQILGQNETGAHNLKLVYASDQFGASYAPLGIDAGQVYFTADGKVMSYPVAGGTAKTVGDMIGWRELVHGGALYGFKPGANNAPGSMVSAPITDLSMTKTLAEGIAEPQLFVADDTALYFDRRDPTTIFELPLTGGIPTEIVPGGSPLGMISHLGNLYWLDFETNQLERVPVAGGPRQKLTEVFFGGPMAADGNSVFWADTSLSTIESWQEGASMSQKLVEGAGFFSKPEDVAVAGDTVYWVVGGFGCGEVHQVKEDGTGKSLYTQGTAGADWIGVADGALFVLGRGGLYRADR